MTLHTSRVDGVYCPHCHKDITDYVWIAFVDDIRKRRQKK
jgi:hypothetical protein